MVKKMDDRFSIDSAELEFHLRRPVLDERLGESGAASAGVFSLE